MASGRDQPKSIEVVRIDRIRQFYHESLCESTSGEHYGLGRWKLILINKFDIALDNYIKITSPHNRIGHYGTTVEKRFIKRNDHVMHVKQNRALRKRNIIVTTSNHSVAESRPCSKQSYIG